MTCGGCSGAINRVLKKAQDSGEGVTFYDVSLENQSVEVRGPIDFELLTAKIEKTGKKVRFRLFLYKISSVTDFRQFVLNRFLRRRK